MAKIPKQAKRVFHGVIFDVYQWRQKMYDGTYKTFEMLKRPNTIEVISVVGNKIYIAEQEQPGKSKCYTLLGGRQEKETGLQTARRELLEEAGMRANRIQIFKKYSITHKMDWSLIVYIARGCEVVAEQRLDGGEKIKILPVDFDRFIEIILSDKFWGGLEFVHDVLKMKHNKPALAKFKQQIFGK
ncbi:NUDIX domain-containing protein [Candidatus Falkowbacteria bacterium]|nr:NUDIX domain-containing protein [Candidatus Falkowbacteria bacterium]